MRGIIRFAAVACAPGLAGGTQAATVLDFNGLTPAATFTTTAKDGFIVTALTGQAYPGLNYFTVALGGTSTNGFLGFGAGPQGVSITGPGLFTVGDFTFARTGAVDNQVQVLTVTGYRNGAVAFTQRYDAPSYTLGTVSTPTAGFQSTQVDRVTFVSDGFHTGGVLDNINVTALDTALPEPASWAMMLLGFGGLASALRRRPRRLARIRFA